MYDARERSLGDQILRIHTPRLGLHSVAARCQYDIFRVRAVSRYTAVHPRLFQRDELPVIVHDHRQRRRAALQHFQLHHHRHLYDAFGLGLRDILLITHEKYLSHVKSVKT